MPILCSLLLGSLPVAPAEDKDLFTLYIADTDTFFANEKDAGLLNAFKMINARMAELPGEIPDFPQLPPEMVSLVIGLLTGEKSLRIGSTDDPGMPFPIYGQLDVIEGDEAAAQHLAETLTNLGRMAGVLFGEAREDGLLPLVGTDPVEVSFGAKGSSVVLSAGKAIDHGVDLGTTGLPAGVDPSFLMRLDLGGLMDLAEKWLTIAGQAEEFENPLAQVGMDRLTISIANGSDSERSYTVTRMSGYGDWVAAIGMLPRRNLAAADINIIPKSAMFATVGTTNFQGTLDYVLAMLEPELAKEGVTDPVGMLAALTGFHLQEDLVDHLGDAFGLYTSDATGGGGLLSLVCFVELSNPEGMLNTIERLEDIINGVGASAAQGYVRTRHWQHGGNEYVSLIFPGLPIPAEPTLSVSGNHLFIGMTPGATVGAVDSAQRPEGLTDNPRFVENLPHPIADSQSISFADSPRMLRHGYGITSLLCSALVNGTRSRFDDSRDAGMIMPTFPELVRGAKASVWSSYMDGDDYVSEQWADSSMLVNMTSAVGWLASYPGLILIPLALVGVAEGEAGFSEVFGESPALETIIFSVDDESSF
jgi:hypothetical protein